MASDRPAAVRTVTDMLGQVDAGGWALLDKMLTREGMPERVRSGDLGFAKRENFGVLCARAEALLLMDSAPSDEFENCLTRAVCDVTPTQRRNAEKFDAWVRLQIVTT